MGRSVTIKSGDFRNTVAQLTDEFDKNASRNLKLSVIDAGEVALASVKENSPVDTGVYRSGWVLETDERADHITATVKNVGEHKALTHLLEFGHEGFYYGHPLGHRIAGRPHIAKAWAKGKNKLMQRWKGGRK